MDVCSSTKTMAFNTTLCADKMAFSGKWYFLLSLERQLCKFIRVLSHLDSFSFDEYVSILVGKVLTYVLLDTLVIGVHGHHCLSLTSNEQLCLNVLLYKQNRNTYPQGKQLLQLLRPQTSFIKLHG